MTQPDLKLVMSDVHIPYHDKRAFDLFLTVLADVQPVELIIIGDFLDCLAQARWSVGSRFQYDNTLVPKEIEAGQRALTKVRDAYDGFISFHTGNHEDRHMNAVRKFLPWAENIMPTIEDLLDFEHFEIAKTLPTYNIAPGVISIHGKRLSSTQSSAGQSAYKERMRHGYSIVQGHSHRLGLGWDTQEKERFWMECGWLGDVKQASYLEFPGQANWQQGFGALWIDGRNVYPEAVKVTRGTTRFDGKWYKA